MAKKTKTFKAKTQAKTESVESKVEATSVKVEADSVKTESVSVKAESVALQTESASQTKSIATPAESISSQVESVATQTNSTAMQTESKSIAAKPTEKKKVVQRSPLDGKDGGGVLQIQEIVGQTLINLRGKTDDDAFMQAMKNTLGAPPLVANTTTTINNGVIFWLGPDEWQARFYAPPAAEVLLSLRQSLTDVHAAYTEVSDYYTVIRIAGAHAQDALAAACPLDLHAIQSGGCAQSHYAKAAILLYQKDDAPTFDLQIRWSYAEYVWQYLSAVTGDL